MSYKDAINQDKIGCTFEFVLRFINNIVEKSAMSQKEIDKIKDRIAELDQLIAETKGRLPAHSTKPPVMMDLLALEDEYDELLEKLKALKSGG